MSETTEHGRQLASAAKSSLLPLGCKRIGRSRTWIADQRFWVIVIEFQPSGFSKGSYLNVGACWLWYTKNYWSFDHGGRVEPFTTFRDEDQFAAVAKKLAMRAAEEIRTLRKTFASLSDIARQITPAPNARAWPLYHAAVAAGLAGNIATSERLFKRLIEEPVNTEWEKKLQADSAELAQTLPDAARFRAAILTIIQQSRGLLGLPPDPNCLDAP
jgi:hypothetical protein